MTRLASIEPNQMDTAQGAAYAQAVATRSCRRLPLRSTFLGSQPDPGQQEQQP